METVSQVPKVSLSNGLRVANFSSPHPFTFEDGSVLEACSAERAKTLMLGSIEVETPNRGGWTDIGLEWELSAAVEDALIELEQDDEVDIVLVPFPVMTALKEAGRDVGKARVIRVRDRVTKEIHIDRFCC